MARQARRLTWREYELPTLILLAIAGGCHAAVQLMYYLDNGWLLADAHAYWLTGQGGYQPYQLAAGALDAFLYSPAFAQLITPMTWLPWAAFGLAWIILETLAFVWLFRPVGWLWTGVALLWCSSEILLGNVVGFLAVATVLGLSGWPQAWALLVLTKPTLGVGALWHVVRGEWRLFGIAFATTAGIVAVSFALDSDMWFSWILFLFAQAAQPGGIFLVRFVLAVAVVAFAARTGRTWLIPPALVLATPWIGGAPVLTLLAAVPRLLPPAGAAPRERERSERPEGGAPGDQGALGSA